MIRHNNCNANNLLIHDHQLARGSGILPAEKIISEEIHDIFIFKVINPCNLYFEELIKAHNHNWKQIYSMPRITTYRTCMCSFEYKILKNVMFLNKKLHLCEIINSLLCPFCGWTNETPLLTLHLKFTQETYLKYK